MKKYWSIAASLLAVLSACIYFRCYPVFLPQFRANAERTVERQISQDIYKDITKNYSNLGDLAKSRLFERQLADYRKENKESIKKRVQEEYDKIKDHFQDSSGRTYLLELDGWHWARYVANIGRFGGLGDQVKDGEQFDSFMLYPQGAPLKGNAFFYYFS